MQRQPEVTMAYAKKVLSFVPFVSYWHESKPGDYQWSQESRLHAKRLDLLHATAWFSVSPISQEYIRQFALWVLNAPSLGPIAADRFRKQYDYAFSPFASKDYRNEVISRALALQGKGPLNMETGEEFPENDGMPPLQQPGRARQLFEAARDRFVNGSVERVMEGDSDDGDDEEREASPTPNALQRAAGVGELDQLMANVRIADGAQRFVARPGPGVKQNPGRGQAAMMRKRRGLGAPLSSEHDTTAAELWDSVQAKLPTPARLLLTSQLGLGLDPGSALKQLKTRDGQVDYLGALQPKARGTGQVLRSSGLGAPAYRKDKRASPELASALLTVHSKLPQRQRKAFERLVELVLKDLANVQSHTEKTEVNAEAASIIARLGLLNTIQTLNVSKRVQNVFASQLA